MSKYFGHSPQDWERSMMQNAGSGGLDAMKDALKNPENYTTSKPNVASKSAFVVGSTVGGGRDGMKKGSDTAYYKIEKPSTHTSTAAPTPTPAPQAPPSTTPKPKEPVEYSPEIQQAKERVKSYENDVLSGKVSEEIYNPDYSKDTYINRGDSNDSQYDFSQSVFNPQQKATQAFLDKKKADVKHKLQDL